MEKQDNDQSNGRRSRGRPRDWDDKTAQNTIKSLDRAMEILEYLSDHQGKSLSVLASELSQSPATLYRVLVTLEARGLVDFDPVDQVWHIGAKSFTIGTKFLRRTSLVERARPVLRKLMEDTGETANLAIEKGGMVLFLSQVETHETIRAFFPPGTLSPMHASGIGKALLAHMHDDSFDRWAKSNDLVAFTPYTFTDRDLLSDELAITRERGFSIDAEERNLGMECIAAPVFDMNQEAIAGLSVSGPKSRISADVQILHSHAVMQAAKELSIAIGGDLKVNS
ncbi:MAG: HTH-type transcriptional regulator BhcR [Planktomarina sp.]